MKRYAFSGALVCALLLSGCGKIDHTAGPISATQPATAQQFTDAPALAFSAADSDPYQNVIQYYLEQYQSDSAQDDSLPEPTYALYDMDKDGSPELIVRTGYNEAEYTFCVWTADADKDPVQVEGDASGSHTMLYGSDSENGFFTSGCYMDTQNITQYTLTEGNTLAETVCYQGQLVGESQIAYGYYDFSAGEGCFRIVQKPLSSYAYQKESPHVTDAQDTMSLEEYQEALNQIGTDGAVG